MEKEAGTAVQKRWRAGTEDVKSGLRRREVGKKRRNEEAEEAEEELKGGAKKEENAEKENEG